MYPFKKDFLVVHHEYFILSLVPISNKTGLGESVPPVLKGGSRGRRWSGKRLKKKTFFMGAFVCYMGTSFNSLVVVLVSLVTSRH